MFKGHTVVTEDEVGDFIAKLHKETYQPLDEVCNENFDGMVRESETTTTGTQS